MSAGKRFLLFLVFSALSFLFAEETEERPKDFGGLFRGEAYAWYIPHRGGPLKIRASCYSQNGAVLVRMFDRNGEPVLWRYSGVSGIVHTDHDFGKNAPPGNYQVRAAFRGAKIRIACTPEHAFGIMPLKTWLYAENKDQFKNVFFRFPGNIKSIGYDLRSGSVKFRDPEGVIRQGKFLFHNKPEDEIWSADLSLKTQWDHLFRIRTFPAIFTPDKETAERIGSVTIKDQDGTEYAFPFQKRAAKRIRELKKDLPPVPGADLKKYQSLFEASPRSRYLIGPRGILSSFQCLIERSGKKTDFSEHLALASLVWALDKPYNPWYKSPALQKHIVHAAMKFLLKIEITDTYGNRKDGWSATAASDLFQYALAFAAAGPLLPRADRDLWSEGIRRVADRYPFFPSSRESYTTRWPLICRMIGMGSGEKAYYAIAEDYVRMILIPENSRSMRTGYLRENLGCDPWSQGESVLHLALYYRLTGSKAAKEGLRKIFHFLNHSVVPVGNKRFVSASNFAAVKPLGWSDRRFYNEGTELLRQVLPEANCWPVTPSGEEQLSIAQLLRVRADAPAKAVTPDSPYFVHWLFAPAQGKTEGLFPAQESAPFVRQFNGEFTAVRTKNAYMFLYNGNNTLKKSWIGKHYIKYDGRSRPRNWEKRANRNWDIVPGLGIAASPKFGPFVVSRSCNGRTLHMLIHEGGKKAVPVYHDFLNSGSQTFTDGSVKITFKTRPDGSLSAERKIIPLSDGVRITLSVNRKGSRSGRVMEQIPFLRYPDMKIAWWKNGKWHDTPQRTGTLRFGEHFYICFDRQVETVFAQDTFADGLRSGCLRIPLDEFFPDKGPLEFSYAIRFR